MGFTRREDSLCPQDIGPLEDIVDLGNGMAWEPSSSSDEEIDFVPAPVPLSPKVRRTLPHPPTEVLPWTIRRNRLEAIGKKRRRRFANIWQLITLEAGGDEDDNLVDTYGGYHFSQLSTEQEWESLVDNPFDDYNTDSELVKMPRRKGMKHEAETENMYPPEIAYRNLNADQRSFFKKNNVPSGMILHLEDKVVSFFVDSPKDIYTSPPLTGFQRMILHALASYHRLHSLSFDCKDAKHRLTSIHNCRDVFLPCGQLLCDYLKQLKEQKLGKPKKRVHSSGQQ